MRRGQLGKRAEPVSPEPDIRVALAVLHRLVQLVGKRDLDLSRSNLSGADLMGMYLLDARLNDANLTGAKLNEAYLVGADLRGALLKDVQFYNANFTDVQLDPGQISLEELKADNVTGLKSVQLESANTPGAIRSARSEPPPSRRRPLPLHRLQRENESKGTLPRPDGGSPAGTAD